MCLCFDFYYLFQEYVLSGKVTCEMCSNGKLNLSFFDIEVISSGLCCIVHARYTVINLLMAYVLKHCESKTQTDKQMEIEECVLMGQIMYKFTYASQSSSSGDVCIELCKPRICFSKRFHNI